MVWKVIEHGVSISLFWRDVVRNTECSFFFEKNEPFFCVGDMKTFRVSSLSSAKSRRFSMTIGLSSSVSSSRKKSRKE